MQGQQGSKYGIGIEKKWQQIAIVAFSISLMTFPQAAEAKEMGSWGTQKPNEEMDNLWSDFPEVKPDLHPDSWSVDSLAKFTGEEIMLRSSNNALLRWISPDQIRELNAVRNAIEIVAELEVDFYITTGDQPNAAAGKREGVNSMFVNFAMLDLIENDRDLWASLIGHEIAHLKLGHLDEQAKRSIPMAVIKTISQGLLATDPLLSTAGGLLVDGIGMKFSRDAERQSDYMGLIWALEADYDPYGAARLHTEMSGHSANFSVPFFSSHPSSPERIKDLTELADRLSR